MTKNSPETHRELTSFSPCSKCVCFGLPGYHTHSLNAMRRSQTGRMLKLNSFWHDCQNNTHLVPRPWSENSLLDEGHRDAQWPLKLTFSLWNYDKEHRQFEEGCQHSPKGLSLGLGRGTRKHGYASGCLGLISGA